MFLQESVLVILHLLALSAGIKAPLLVTVPHPRYPQAELVSALGALLPIYTPLNVREEEPTNKFEQLGLLPIRSERLLDHVEAFEAAFTVCRDVGETGPERMSPPNVAEYVKVSYEFQSAFPCGKVKVEVTDDQKVIEKEYPLMAAVNRCANTVKEHQARLVRLEYVGEGEIKDTYMMVGKGVTIDTGGCDLKTGGHMWGMCRDKYGSAVVAGFFKALEILKPKNIKAVGYMCMVRNSIGARCYTTDEVIKARSGKRIHIYNTDAEGRITMLDPLTRAKEEALKEKNPHLMTLATLTGHEVLTYGYYAAIMDNGKVGFSLHFFGESYSDMFLGPAKKSGWARKIQETGDVYGQPIEISRLHPEDFEFHKAECEQAHIRQGNTKPSVATLRGHQTPAAFLIMASRLDEHGCDSEHPLKFTHIDIGSAAGDHPETSLPNPLVTLVAESVLLSFRNLSDLSNICSNETVAARVFI
ncbi:cytosol aminopeptidase family, catalytic domain protein [Ancylostoma caninum]|uniref:Cytosol aminopeptidase family, catalytic domain protein n=1 Tax=Ancylostoma caninum TaxID=29170 RepID=A0A368FK56_ANCCA|nr:cytosol aminopeptidase family, catalytic domain protein [Ancylostoma caninum]